MTEPITRDVAVRFMRRAIVRFSKEQTGNTFSSLMDLTIHELERAGLVSEDLAGPQPYFKIAIESPRAPSYDIAIVLNEGFQLLVALGYVVARPTNTGGLNWNWVTVTPTGREWAAGGEPVPEDQSGYLAAFDELNPEANPMLRQYVAEAVAVYDRRAFFAAAVMLGAASEAALYELADAARDSMRGCSEARGLASAIERHRAGEVLGRILNAIEEARRPSTDPMPYPVHEGADRHLGSLLEAIRRQRNDAGHPTAAAATPAGIRLGLSAFPAACRKACDLTEWFRSRRS